MTKGKKILVADDDLGILDALCIMLEFEGYDVQCTDNGSDLLSLKDELPDLVLLDIWMSGVDGRNICRQLRQMPETRNIPIIMISASSDIEDSAMSAGANDFVPKPFNMNGLLGKIQKNLEVAK